MNFPNATIILSVNKNFKPFLRLLFKNLQFSGVRYELFIISECEDCNFEFLSPKKVYINKNGSECINEIIAQVSSSNLIFISEPFICKVNWLKNFISLKNKTLNCGSVILPFHSYISNLELTHRISCDFEIEDVYVTKKNVFCGITLLGLETVKMLGGFNIELPFDEAIVEYNLRAKKIGRNNIVSFEFLTALFEHKNIEISNCLDIIIERKIRDFTPIEQIAYHDLDNFFIHNKLEAEKFMFEFTGVFGFNCNCLNQNLTKNLNKFCAKFNLSYEIKSVFLSSAQRLDKTLYILFSPKH